MKRLLLVVALVAALIPATAQALPTDCNAIVSMSQGRQVYVAAQQAEPPASPLEALTGEEWMLQWQGGKTLGYFTQAANWNALQERHRCGTDAEVDSVVFIFDPWQSFSDSGSNMVARLGLVEAIVAARYPNAEFYPTMLVGAEGHVDCVGNGQRASATHADRIDILEAASFTVGPDLDIPCSSYVDPIGHLSNAGAQEANGEVAVWFNGLGQELVIPPTIPHPGISTSNGFRIGVTDLTTNTLLWSAPYLHTTPYVADSGWLNGDRVAYHCAFAFLQLNGEITGRVTFRSVPTDNNNPDGAYIRINDTHMEEGERYYDGSFAGVQQVPFGECPQNVGVEYQPGDFPDERPNVVYYTGSQAVELRDYAQTSVAPGLTFDMVELITTPFVLSGFPVSADHTVNSRATVLARYNGVPVAVVYYDGLGDGQVLIEGGAG